MAGKRLTKKEIQKDQIRDALQETYGWVDANRNLLLAGIGIVLLLVVAVYAIQSFMRSGDDELQVAFADALKVLQAPLSGDAAAVEPGHEGHDHLPVTDLTFETAAERDQRALEAFQAIADENSGKLADFAAFYVAVSRDRLGNSSQAEAELQNLASRSGSSEVKDLAYGYLANLGERQGNWDLAIESLTKLAESSASSSSNFPRETAMYRLAQTLEASGKRAEALEEYRKLIAEFPQHPNSREINGRIDFLGAILGEATGAAESEDNQQS